MVFNTKEKDLKETLSSKKKVFVGLSGGVDSSVSALLLQKAGYDVTGVFIKVWQPENSDCTWKEDRRDAMRVAASLGIKFLTLDLRDEYKRGVVDYMIDEYAKGRTPNPDVMCNKEVKFGGFMNFAIANGADYVATGHYAQVINGEMFEGHDTEKDQSYFLWTIDSFQLEKILFPIGHLEKSEVRNIAKKNKIPVASKKDSQGVCFIGHIDMKDFIREHILSNTSGNITREYKDSKDTKDAKDAKDTNSSKNFKNEKTFRGLTEGNVLDINGNIIGLHEGSLLYTIGERHGMLLKNKSINTPRFYVIDKDIEKNTITVAEKEQMKNDGAGMVEKLVFDDVHFISDDYKKELMIHPIDCLARARYRQKKEKCTLSFINNKYEVVFDRPEDGITPGQSLVLYFANAIIDKNIKAYSTNKVDKRGAKTLGGVII
jgi:tRNA-uridine 2-sulfurtransferase